MVHPEPGGASLLIDAPAPEERDRRPPAAVWTAGWTPAGLATLIVVVLWLRSGVSVRDTVAFSAYLGLALTVPGTLIWRRVWGERPRPFALDVMAGLVIGYTIELPVYLLARAVGLPLLTPLWSLSVICVALAVPSYRRLWRARGCVRMPALWSWSMAALVVLTLLWFAYAVWWQHPVSFNALGKSYSDEQLSLALVGELRHHVPPQIPWVAGEPLRYHWYLYGHMAASSWMTGIEPAMLMRRLSVTPLVVVPIIGAAVTAGHVSRRTWAGPVCAALLVAVGPINSGWWMALALPYGQLFTDVGLAFSPTATYGTAVFALVLFMCMRILAPGEPPVSRSYWIALAAVLGLQAGAKPTFLPILLVGLATVVGLQLLTRRRPRSSVVVLLLLTFGWLLFARFVIYGGAGGGIGLDPFDAGDHALRVLKPSGVENPQLTAALIVVAVIVALLAKAVAALALLPRPRPRGLPRELSSGGLADPRVLVLLASTAAGWGAFVLLGHAGLSQAAFAKATALPLCVAAAWGVSRLVAGVPAQRHLKAVAASALAVGALVTAAMWQWWLPSYEEILNGSWRDVVGPPLLVVTVVTLAVVVTGLLVPLTRRSPRLLALAVCLALIGSGALFGAQMVRAVARKWEGPQSIRPVVIGKGGVKVAHWIRAHSSPDDLLATNEHLTRNNGSNRTFWLAAHAERRVLVEGWGYTERINSRNFATATQNQHAPFWDVGMLQANDAVFTRPSSTALRRLAADYGVRWLVLNRRLPSQADELAQVADLRYERGIYSVYEVPDSAVDRAEAD